MGSRQFREALEQHLAPPFGNACGSHVAPLSGREGYRHCKKNRRGKPRKAKGRTVLKSLDNLRGKALPLFWRGRVWEGEVLSVLKLEE